MINWIEELPLVQGLYLYNAPLAMRTWFRVGGPADVVYRPAGEEDLVHFLANKPKNIPVSIIGAGSNLLVRDGGVSGVVVRLRHSFSNMRIEGNLIHAGAACLDRTVSLTCREAGVGNLEFLAGIPGTLGGAVRMNAGAYGQEIKDILVYAHVLDEQGKPHRLTPEDLGMSYRRTSLPEGWIVTRVVLKGVSGQNPQDIGRAIEDILAQREATQPIRGRTGGSCFKNPGQQKAWQLIDAAGCRGLKRGDAQVCEKHCNFLINLDQATANDLESLAEEVKRRVYETSGIWLDWEIVKMGRPE